jgi:hypothetical protein
MSGDKLMPRIPGIPLARQAGAAAVEFALVVLAFLLFVFCVIEVARALYLWNTLQEVTRRAASAAASTDFSDVAAINSVRQQAVFRTSPGKLSVGDPVTDAHVRIDYMSLARASDGKLTLTEIPNGTLPSCPARNQVVCTADSNAANCIRFVRVRICAPGGDASACDPVQYVPMLPLVTVSSLPLPPSTTIVRAETLGYQPGESLCP